MRLNEHVYRVAVTFKMTERVEQWIRITFCVKLEHCLCGKYFDDAEGRSYGQQVIASFITTVHLLVHHVLCRVFRWNIKSPRWLPRFGALRLLAFPKTKITFERDFRLLMRFRKIQWGSWWWLGELCEVPRCPLWRGLRCHCPMYNVLISSSINVSIFHIIWRDTFWTDLVHTYFGIKLMDIAGKQRGWEFDSWIIRK